MYRNKLPESRPRQALPDSSRHNQLKRLLHRTRYQWRNQSTTWKIDPQTLGLLWNRQEGRCAFSGLAMEGSKDRAAAVSQRHVGLGFTWQNTVLICAGLAQVRFDAVRYKLGYGTGARVAAAEASVAGLSYHPEPLYLAICSAYEDYLLRSPERMLPWTVCWIAGLNNGKISGYHGRFLTTCRRQMGRQVVGLVCFCELRFVDEKMRLLQRPGYHDGPGEETACDLREPTVDPVSIIHSAALAAYRNWCKRSLSL